MRLNLPIVSKLNFKNAKTNVRIIFSSVYCFSPLKLPLTSLKDLELLSASKIKHKQWSTCLNLIFQNLNTACLKTKISTSHTLPDNKRFNTTQKKIYFEPKNEFNIIKLKTMYNKLIRKLYVFTISAILIAPEFIQAQSYTGKFLNATASVTGAYQNATGTQNDYARGITVDGKGNSYVVGSFFGTATFGSVSFTSAGTSDVFLEKYDKNGIFQWAVHGTGTQNDDAKSVTVYPDGAGGVNTYVTGYFTGSITFKSASPNPTIKTLSTTSGGSGPTDMDMFIVKYNNVGQVMWALNCGNTMVGQRTIGWDIAVNNDANNFTGGVSIWVSGSFEGTTSFVIPGIGVTSGGNQNGFIACYTDMPGTIAPVTAKWENRIKTNNTGNGVAVDADNTGVVYLTGYWEFGGVADFGGAFSAVPNYGQNDGFVARYDNTGVVTRAIHFGSTAGTTSGGTSGQGIAVSQSGDVYVSGSFVGPTLPTLQVCTFPNALTLTSLGGPLLGTDGFVMKLDNSLNSILWLTQIGGATGDDDAKRMVVDNCGQRCYVVGDFRGTESFGNSVTLVATGTGDRGYLADFNANSGLAIAATQCGGTGTGNDYAYDVSINAVEDIQYCGAFASTGFNFTVAPLPPTLGILTNAGASDGFVARWDHSNWPALETTGNAINQGCSVVDCKDYAVGDFSGTSSFLSLPSLTSNGGYRDIYLLSCDKYAVFTSFLRLTSGTSGETARDVVSDVNYHYVVGSALTAAAPVQTGVTFVGDLIDSYTASSNYGSNALLIKSSLAGTIQWASTIRPVAASSNAYGMGVAHDATGNIYLCGYYSGTVAVYNSGGTSSGNLINSGTSNDIFVIKYSNSGVVLWKKTFGSPTGDDRALGISIDPASSNYYITGSYSGTIPNTVFPTSMTAVGGIGNDGYLMKGNLTNLTPICNVSFGTSYASDQGNDIYVNGLDEVYVTGHNSTVAGAVYIARFDMTNPAVINVWNINSTGSGTGSGNDILLGTNGYVYVSGMVSVSGGIQFGSLPSLSPVGAYVVGLSSWNGIPIWGSTLYATASQCNGLAEDDGNLSTDHGFVNLICGNLTGGSTQAYLHKVTQEGLEFSARYGHTEPIENNIPLSDGDLSTIFPNPFNNTATLKLQSSIDAAAAPVSILIFDMTGRIVERIDNVTSQETTISGENFVNGIYFYQVIQNESIVSTGKMMINK